MLILYKLFKILIINQIKGKIMGDCISKEITETNMIIIGCVEDEASEQISSDDLKQTVVDSKKNEFLLKNKDKIKLANAYSMKEHKLAIEGGNKPFADTQLQVFGKSSALLEYTQNFNELQEKMNVFTIDTNKINFDYVYG